jgi:hypothetical protein
MNWNDEDLAALQELETAIARIFRKHPDMTDYAAGRAYEGAFQMYRALNRGHQPKPSTLTGLDAEVFDAVRTTCEKMHAEGAVFQKSQTGGRTAPVSLPKMVEYLRQLQRSVERHTAMDGRQGYLTFIQHFV